MRILNAVAALSGLVALILLAAASHGAAYGDGADNLRVAAMVQLVSAIAGVFAAGRHWRLDLAAGALIVGGSILFSLAVATHALANIRQILWMAPVGGILMMLGWVVLAFAAPTKRPG